MTAVSYLTAFFLSLFFLCPGSAIAVEQDFLNAGERAWLAEHPVITVAPDPDASPYEWLDNKGNYRGISADYLNIIAGKLGVRFQVIKSGSWAEVLKLAQRKEVDLLSAVALTRQRQSFLSFTDPYLTMPGVLISAQEYQSVEELMGKRVAVVAGHFWDEVITQHEVDVVLIRTENLAAALELTSMGAVEAMVGDLARSTEMISISGITNLRIVKHLDTKLKFSLGVRKEWPQFTVILNKTLATIDQQQHDEIRQRWVKLIDISWWQDSSFRTATATVAALFFLCISVVIIWNRALARQVQKRAVELEEVQGQLIHAAKLESVGQLAAGVAHEVKNPLAIIRMGIEFLAGSTNADDTEQEVLIDMEDAVQRADTVILGLLDFSRDQKLQLQPGGDINEVIRQSLHLIEHEVLKKKILLSQDLEILPPVALDFGKLQQVLINLLMNSIQAMEKKGELRVVSRLHKLNEKEAASAHHFHRGMTVIEVLVQDNGSGIDKKGGDKIFDPFYTTKEVGQGTGLGLSVSRNIIELHHGTLQLENRKNGGVCAAILLPCMEGEENEKEDSINR